MGWALNFVCVDVNANEYPLVEFNVTDHAPEVLFRKLTFFKDYTVNATTKYDYDDYSVLLWNIDVSKIISILCELGYDVSKYKY